MIGSYNNANLVWGIFPSLWGKGDGTSDVNTGPFASAPLGAFQPCTMTGMAAGDGYLYAAGVSYLQGDGINNEVTSLFPFSVTDASKFTIELSYRTSFNGSSQMIFALFDDASNNFGVYHLSTGAIIMAFVIGGVTKRLLTTDTLVNGNTASIAVRKDGATLQAFIQGAEVAAYTEQDAYDLGTKAFTVNPSLLLRSGSGAAIPAAGRIRRFGMYDDAIIDQRILDNHNLGLDLGLKGFKVGNTLAVTDTGLPTITSLDVIEGPASGSTRVVITGTNYEEYYGTLGVTFDGNPASIISNNATTITLDTPPGSVGDVDVVVTTGQGMIVTDAGGFTYVPSGRSRIGIGIGINI